MALSYPLSLPATNQFNTVTWITKNVVGMATSPFSLVAQVQKHTGERWQVRAALIVLKRAEAEKWAAFITACEGSYRSFLMEDPVANVAQGSASVTPGTPVVHGALQTGSTLTIRGGPASATNYLKAGDLIQLGSGATTRMHKILQDASTDGSGNVTLEIWPSLRESPSDGATVVVDGAKCLMRMGSSELEWGVGLAQVYRIDFEAMEVL